MIGFSPVTATLGGILIGLGAGLLWIMNGRIAGVSNIFGSLLAGSSADLPWRLLFLAGLPAGAMTGLALLRAFEPGSVASATDTGLGPFGLAGAGLLVGVGTALARGCTSGHGVCGLARLSRRSFAAVAIFMVAAMITVYLVRAWPR